MTVLVMIESGSENWAPPRWRERFAAALPGRRVALSGVDAVDPAEVRYAAVWKPKPGALAALPNLEVIFNLGAGVDAVMADTTVPAHVPLVRVATDDLTDRMAEYVLLHTLMLHRRQRELDAAQAAREWWPKDQWAAKDLRVGVMGLGVIGADSAAKLKMVGFDVAGWSRTPKDPPGIPTFAGAAGLAPFLARTDVLVVLLPLTPDTAGILNLQLFRGLARDGRLGAPAIVNAGRGGLQVEADIVQALDEGTLGHAVLDVFAVEPLPATSPLWSHPKITITPHNAADSDSAALTAYVVDQIRSHEAGKGLRNVVDRRVGY